MDTGGFTLTVEEIAAKLSVAGQPLMTGGKVVQLLRSNQPVGHLGFTTEWLRERGISRLAYENRASADRYVYEINFKQNKHAAGFVERRRRRGGRCDCPTETRLVPGYGRSGTTRMVTFKACAPDCLYFEWRTGFLPPAPPAPSPLDSVVGAVGDEATNEAVVEDAVMPDVVHETGEGVALPGALPINNAVPLGTLDGGDAGGAKAGDEDEPPRYGHAAPDCEPKTPASSSLSRLFGSMDQCASLGSGAREDCFPNVVQVLRQSDPLAEDVYSEIGIRCEGAVYALSWSDFRQWILEKMQSSLALQDENPPSRIRDAAAGIRDSSWRDLHTGRASHNNAAVSRDMARLLARKFGVPDDAFDELDQSAQGASASAARSRPSSRSVKQRMSRSRTPETAEPFTDRDRTPRDSDRRRRGGVRKDASGLEVLFDAAHFAFAPGVAETYGRRTLLRLANILKFIHKQALDDLIREAVLEAERTKTLPGLLLSLGKTLGYVHCTLKKSLRAVFLRAIVNTSALADVDGVPEGAANRRRIRELTTSNRANESAVAISQLLNRRGLYKLLGALEVRFKSDGNVRRLSENLFAESADGKSRTDRNHRAEQRQIASIVGGLYGSMCGLNLGGKDSAASTFSCAPKPTLEMAENIARSIASGVPLPALSDPADADGETAKSAAALVRLLQAVAPTPTMMHVLEGTDYGRELRALLFERGWRDKDLVEVTLAFNLLKRRGGVSDAVMTQTAIILDSLLRSALGATKGSIVVPRSKEQRDMGRLHLELFETPMLDERVLAEFIDDDSSAGSVRVHFGFALLYDLMARPALYRNMLAPRWARLFEGSSAPLKPAEAVVHANRHAVDTWLGFKSNPRATVVTHFVTVHIDAAHVSRSRSLVKTIETTSMILGLPLKDWGANRTEQTLLVFLTDVGDASKYTDKHMSASSNVPSMVEQIDMLRAGQRYPYPGLQDVECVAKLLLAANDLKGVKEMLGHLGFGADRDMPWTAASRNSLVFVDDFGLFTFAPIAYTYEHVVAVHAAGGKKALHEVLALTCLPVIRIDAVECAHGGLHFGTAAKAFVTLMAKLHVTIGGQTNLDKYLRYIGERLGHPVQCNIKARETTWPYGGKAGEMCDALSSKYPAMMGFVATLSGGDSDSENTIAFVLDAIVALYAVVGLVRNNHFAFAGFSRVAVAAAATANGLISLAFGKIYVSQRVNSEWLAHTIKACVEASKKVGYPVTLERTSEAKEEDLHRHMARFWLACMRGGGKGSRGEVAVRTLKFMLREWTAYQFNFLEKAPLYTSLKTALREERKATRAEAKSRRTYACSPGVFGDYWRVKTGDSSVIATLLRLDAESHSASGMTREEFYAEDEAGDFDSEEEEDDDDDDDDDDDEVDEATGGGVADPLRAALDEDEDDEPAGDAEADEADDEDAAGAAAAAAAADDDELIEAEEVTAVVFKAHTVELLEVKLEAGHLAASALKEDGWKIIFKTTKVRGGHEIRITLEKGEEASFYRVRVEQIYGFSLTQPLLDKEKVSFILVEAIDFGNKNPKSKKWKLAAAGAVDVGPLKQLQPAATRLTVVARPGTGGGLLEAVKNISASSVYLTKRARVVWGHRGAPVSFDVSRTDEARRDQCKTVPLSVAAERPRIRDQAEKALSRFFEHTKFAYIGGGVRMKRKCDDCKRAVYLNAEGTAHCLECDDTDHNSCFQKVEEWLKKKEKPFQTPS